MTLRLRQVKPLQNTALNPYRYGTLPRTLQDSFTHLFCLVPVLQVLAKRRRLSQRLQERRDRELPQTGSQQQPAAPAPSLNGYDHSLQGAPPPQPLQTAIAAPSATLVGLVGHTLSHALRQPGRIMFLTSSSGLVALTDSAYSCEVKQLSVPSQQVWQTR